MSHSHHYFPFSACVALLTAPTLSCAVEQLSETVVTATRADIATSQLATAATVFTREDIDRLQVRSLPDLLKQSAGVDVIQTGGLGQQSSVFMRGTNSNHVLVLVNGIKMGSVSLGTSPFEFIPIDQIERVEITKGPQSSLYGSEAIGGVIQIFTRKGKHNEQPTLSLQAGAGSYDTHQESGHVSGSLHDTWYSVGASNISSQGFSVKSAPNDDDADGYRNTAVNARVGHHFANNGELEAFFMHAEGRNEFDGYFRGDTDVRKFVQQISGVTAGMDVMNNWHSTLRLGQSRDMSEVYKPNNQFDNRYNSTRWNVSWLNQLRLSDAHQLILGTDYRLDEIDSTTAYVEKSRYDVGVFGEMHSRLFDKHFLNGSIRWDNNEAFGDYVTGSVAWRYNSDFGISPFLSFGTAFNAPTFNQLYWPNTGFGGGNPHLKPEESQTVEVGVAGAHQGLRWEIRAYHTEAEQLINGWPPQNINKARINGIEGQFSTEILGWKSVLNMSLLDPRDRDSNTRLLRRSQHNLTFDVSKSFGDFDIGANVIAQGNRPDYNAIGQVELLAGYATVDLRTAYHFDKNWMLSAKLGNVLDKQYHVVNGYNTADRNFFLALHYNR